MHRAIGRAIRGTCRKWRENDVPSVAGEEVRKSHDNRKEKFAPPRHSLNEAIGWTAGIVFSWEIHRRHRLFCHGVSASDHAASTKCPFSLTEAVTQPLYSSFSTSTNVIATPGKAKKPETTIAVSVSPKRSSSIDATPFLQESLLQSDFRLSDVSDDDDGISFTVGDNFESRKKPRKPADSKFAAVAEKIAGDTLSMLGSFQSLRGAKANKADPTTDPPMNAIELLEKGAQYGSSRALYNLGVAYDRKKDPTIAREYYKRAADLGHPLATYNYGIMLLRDCQFPEGLSLMKYAADHGVPEAQAVIKDLSPSA